MASDNGHNEVLEGGFNSYDNSVHGTCWGEFRGGTGAGQGGNFPLPDGVMANDKSDPVFGMIPDPQHYGGSDH